MATVTKYYLGSNCTGLSGDANRVLTLDNNVLTSQEGTFISVNGLLLSITSEYTISHKTVGTTITFINALWDDQNIIVQYSIGTAPTPGPSETEYIADVFQDAFTKTLAQFGQQARIKYYNVSYGAGSYYDDNITLTTSSSNDKWISGVVLPITAGRGSNDALLLQQGRVLTNDTKFYIIGSIDTAGIIKVGLGSPVGNEYATLGEGITMYGLNNTPIYKKLYLRYLTNGSLAGE